MHILTWNGKESNIMSGDVLYTSYRKPELSFGYIALFYEEPTSDAFYIDEDSERKELTEEQKREIVALCESFKDEQDYLVAVINEDRIFEYMEYKREAEKKGLDWVFLPEPENDILWRLTKDNAWEQIYVAFTEDGTPYYNPRRGHPYVLFMNADEYAQIGERPTMAHSLNFTTMQWVDARDIDRLKLHAKSDIFGYFQYWRAHYYEGRVSIFETSTWTIQKSEAESWLADSSAPTPFIDGMLSKVEGLSKEELCRKIVNHYSDEELYNLGELHGEMYSYIYAVEQAKTIAEIDQIMIGLKKYTGGKPLINISSEYRPAVKSYGDSAVVVNDESGEFYHTKLN